ncbi:hypothetical protein BN7_1205 [Wickerhamomyces ciferrii]|uniref:PhoD-like phosphatase domain-containing protein n=1 Tax=Wickerhamomyces ciferrii (strain ATCC 14091 / BCRC 22168 / CBS 111 / JCM 3599 / NBRC 0793 / NRRL Y-1031 F-60-10) TaxID=1206466 RepID=K0KJK1_WICCF|nr:uncharacterized protein BN7_1205 [Wickerhamomyces ciferrii]CCH41664.1 hypothetical protein BN7_1205 [Wickerhamomyces ciferrii]
MSLQNWIQDVQSVEQIFQIHKDSKNIPDECPINDPIGGVDIRCGPILRLISSLENNSNNYRASIMLVVKGSRAPKITYVQGPVLPNSLDELNQGEYSSEIFAQVEDYSFYRFLINTELIETEQKIRYTINDSLSYDFFLPSANQPMNIISYSCNGFSLSTDTSSYNSSLWYDVLQRHQTQQRYHVMLGGGDQIYCDAIKNASELFHNWLEEKNPIKKQHQKLTPDMAKSFHDFYIEQYLKWYGQGFWVGTQGKILESLFPRAMATIPSINIYDDHDIIDGYGSYRDSTMGTEIFKGVGSIAYKYYMLFQQQVNPENDEKAYLKDPSWILGSKPGPWMGEPSHSIFTKLGKGIGFLGLDCRTERKLKTIVSQDTYSLIFQRLESELKSDPTIKHLLVLLGVPIAYPRLVWLEWLLNSPLLAPARTLAQKGIIAKGLVNEFDGSVEVLDDLNDHWCSAHHKKERNKLIGNLQKLGSSHGVRITILSGDVHLAAIGRFKTKMHLNHVFNKEKYQQHNENVKRKPEEDPRLMLNIISSAIVNAPPPDAMAGLLNKRSGIHHFDHHTDEDMVPIFTKDTDESIRSNKEFLNKRNWADLISIKNIPNTNGQYNLGDEKLPGPATGIPKDLSIRDERDLKYKITEDSLIATIHVEKDHTKYESETLGYEIAIPELVGKYQLKDIGVKD